MADRQLCDKIKEYHQWMIDNKRTFQIHQKLYQNRISKTVVECYIEGDFDRVRSDYERFLVISKHIKDPELLEMVRIRGDEITPQILTEKVDHIMRDPRLYDKAIKLLKTLLSAYHCDE